MEIDFSRHSKRRITLYNIDENDVRRIIESVIINKRLTIGKYEEINYDLKIRYGFPLKVVFVIENDRVTVLTAYPLKKERVR